MKRKWMVLILVLLVVGIGMRQLMFPKPIYIGFGAGLSGQWSQLGVQTRNGFLLAVDEINAAGGIKNRKVIPVIMDDRNDNDHTVNLIAEMKEKNVDYFVGFVVSSMTPSVMQIMEETDILVFSPTMSTNYLTGLEDNFLRVCNASVIQADIIIETLSHEDKRDYAIIYDQSNEPYTQPMVDKFLEIGSENGLEKIHIEAFDSRNIDYDAVVEAVHEKNVSNIIILASGVDTAQIAQRLRVTGSQAQFYGSAWATTDELLQSGGQAVENMRVTGLYDIGISTSKYNIFKDKMIETYKYEPSFPDIFGYETMMVLKEGMELADSFEPDQVKQAIIEKESFEGLQHQINFDAYGDGHRTYYIYEIRKGAYQSLIE